MCTASAVIATDMEKGTSAIRTGHVILPNLLVLPLHSWLPWAVLDLLVLPLHVLAGRHAIRGTI